MGNSSRTQLVVSNELDSLLYTPYVITFMRVQCLHEVEELSEDTFPTESTG